MKATIIYAGYGTFDQTHTREVTNRIQQIYAGGVFRFFANNEYGGDPAPNLPKSLFIIWSENGINFSAVVKENEANPISLPH